MLNRLSSAREAIFVFLLFWLPVREVIFHPSNVFLNGDLTVRALIALGESLELPFLEIRFFNLTGTYTSCITLIVFTVNRECGIFSRFRLVVLLRCEILARTCLTFRNTITVQ